MVGRQPSQIDKRLSPLSTPCKNWGIWGKLCAPSTTQGRLYDLFLLGKVRGLKICTTMRGAKYRTKFGAKKHTTHNNTKMSSHRPTPQRLFPVSLMQCPPCPQIIEPLLLIGPQHAHGVGVDLAAAGSFVWVNKFSASKNRVMGGGLALRPLGGRR